MIGIAVLGCGRIGRLHAGNLARHARARLAAVFDVIPEVAQQTAAELAAPRADSVEQVLADREVAAVVVATPTRCRRKARSRRSTTTGCNRSKASRFSGCTPTIAASMRP